MKSVLAQANKDSWEKRSFCLIYLKNCSSFAYVIYSSLDTINIVNSFIILNH